MAYTPPSPEDLQDRYPAFKDVDTVQIQHWLDEAAVECALFPDDIRARAEMAYAAAKMAELGFVTVGVPGGVTSFKSADFSANISEAVANRTGFSASVYGREFKDLQRRYFGGPMLIGGGCAR